MFSSSRARATRSFNVFTGCRSMGVFRDYPRDHSPIGNEQRRAYTCRSLDDMGGSSVHCGDCNWLGYA
jgi:hypothetical protein